MGSNNKIIPHENDILLGRGGKNNRHVGNEKLRILARAYVNAYVNSTKKGKSNISWDIVKAVRSMKPPGRFLKRDPVSEEWQDVGDEAAREKTSQAMRDAIAISAINNDGTLFGNHGIDLRTGQQRGPSRSLTFPTYGEDSRGHSATADSHCLWHSSQAYSYPPVIYSSPMYSRPRSSTTNSALVSPENTKRTFPGGNNNVRKRSASFSEYNALESPPTLNHHHHRWTYPPQMQSQYPRQRLCDDKMLDLDMKQLNSWDNDDDDLHSLPPLNGFDYTASLIQIDGEHHRNVFPNAR